MLTLMSSLCGGVVAQDEDDEPDPDPNGFLMVAQEPTPINMDSIRKILIYPEDCKNRGVQGKVHIRVLVDREGKPIKHIVRKSPDSLLTAAVVSKIYFIRFSPAISSEGGIRKSLKCWVNLPFDFKLNSDKPKEIKKEE